MLRGSKEGFSDSVKTNSALVRKRLRDTRLKVEEQTLGVRSNILKASHVEDRRPGAAEDIRASGPRP